MTDDIVSEEQPELPANDGQQTEAGENGTGEVLELSEEDQIEESEPERKGKSVQDRIDEITAARREAEREAEFWRAKALERDAPKQAEQKADTDAAPDPANYEYGEADPAFIRDITRHEVRQEFAAQQQRAQVETSIREMEANYSKRLESVREELPDYDDKVTKSAARGEWPCPPLVALGIKESEVGPKIAYHLATNRDEAVAIANMSQIDQARALGRLEARFLDQPQPQARIATNAPEPPQARTKGGQFAPSNQLRDDLDQAEWLRRRNAQLQGR